MRITIIKAFSIVLLLSFVAAANAAGTVTVTSPQDASALVYVSGYTLDPEIFYPYETGTVTVHVTNAANASVGVSQPNLIDPNLDILSKDTFTTTTNIGPGTTFDYYFLVKADASDGTYFPIFTVSTNYNSIHSTIKLVVDSANVRTSISDKPDTFSLSKKDTVNVSVVNPRDGNVNDVLIVPDGSGVVVTPQEYFVGTLNAGGSVQVPFQITPQQQSNVTFHVTFRNGNNKHSSEVVLPINIGEDKTAAVPIINNIELVSTGSSYKLTGDVNNAGITDAKSMVLTVDTPARAVEPYAEYSIGSLASDDFSSFELTFLADDLSSVPLKIYWKDADGNTFVAVKNLDLQYISGAGSTSTRTSSSGSAGSTTGQTGSSTARTSGGPQGGGAMFGIGGSRGGGLSSFYPVIAGAIILIVVIVLWMKRKWITAKWIAIKLKKK
jgi:hypothetical protein